MSRVDVMPDYLNDVLFSTIVPIYEFHCGLVKEIDQRVAIWFVPWPTCQLLVNYILISVVKHIRIMEMKFFFIFLPQYEWNKLLVVVLVCEFSGSVHWHVALCRLPLDACVWVLFFRCRTGQINVGNSVHLAVWNRDFLWFHESLSEFFSNRQSVFS